MPRDLAEELGLPAIGRMTARSARGPVELEESYARVELEGHARGTPVVIGDAYRGVLIGVLTLEALGLAVDPVNDRLVEVEILLL